jgi:hypothetical protein
LYKKAEQAYEAGFNKDDNSSNQRAFQRDYIYYGMMPSKTTGELNRSVTEYLSYIEVDPKTYFKISDQQDKQIDDDPHIYNSSVSREKYGYTNDELMKLMWTEGSYNFTIEVSTSLSQDPSKLYVPVNPDEIWNFNIKKTFRHGSFWRHCKNTYTIDPRDFTSKRFYCNPANTTFGKWNIADESLIRYISIYEEDDKGDERDETSTQTFSHVLNSEFKGDLKLSLGLGKTDNGDNAAGDFSSQTNSSNTVTTSWTITIKKKESDDQLGYKIPIYFYDPIVDSKNVSSQQTGGSFSGGGFGGGHSFKGFGGGHFGPGRRDSFGGRSYDYDTPNTPDKYIYHEYNTGSVRFGIDVR